jgi:hypothetical protein
LIIRSGANVTCRRPHRPLLCLPVLHISLLKQAKAALTAIKA